MGQVYAALFTVAVGNRVTECADIFFHNIQKKFFLRYFRFLVQLTINVNYDILKNFK